MAKEDKADRKRREAQEESAVDIYVRLLLVTIQTNAHAEGALHQTITQVRVFALTGLVATICLTSIVSGRELWMAGGFVVLILVLWAYDIFNTDMMRRHALRSLECVKQLSQVRQSGSAFGLELPGLVDHTKSEKFRTGLNLMQSAWYLFAMVFTVLLILFHGKLFF